MFIVRTFVLFLLGAVMLAGLGGTYFRLSEERRAIEDRKISAAQTQAATEAAKNLFVHGPLPNGGQIDTKRGHELASEYAMRRLDRQIRESKDAIPRPNLSGPGR